MREVLSPDKCIGCGVCAAVCPRKCIAMQEDEEGFLQPLIDSNKCVDCGKCRQSCPQLAKSDESCKRPLFVRGAFALHSEIRALGSSGGIFPLLAQEVLSKGGVVYGVAFDENLSVVHVRSESWNECRRIFGSKYVQSRMDGVLIQVKQDLMNHRNVLFSGTPCQIAALRSFLASEDVSHLFCIDFICHGVPSPKLWKDYLEWLKRKYQSPLKDFLFRNKEHGWKKFAMKLCFADGKELLERQKENLYFQLFLSNCCLRKSCYKCRYKTRSHHADLTIGDFWGVLKKYPELDDDLGTSVIFAHTLKGAEMLSAIAGKMEWMDVNYKFVLKKNISARKSVPMPASRTTFFTDYKLVEFSKLIKWYSQKPAIPSKILCFFGNFLKRQRLISINECMNHSIQGNK